jgi:mitochondrial fission protein ELM1
VEVAGADTGQQRTCFVVSDGRRGIENQALGLAEAIGRRINLRLFPLHLPRTGDLAEAGGLAPDLWIGCGRAAVSAAPAHRKAFPSATMVYVQAPRSHEALFDLIVAPRHDRLCGPNVLSTIGSPNRVTDSLLGSAADEFTAELKRYKSPRAAVLIGGDSKHHRFTDATCESLLLAVERMRDQAASVLITTSRRTPQRLVDALQERYGWADDTWIHAGDGPNPYFAFLGGADWICVTEDSTNMLCEAASTGKPVYRLAVDGKPGKFERLYAQLQGVGAVRPFLGKLEAWSYAPLHETERAAEAVLEILTRRTEITSS